MKTLLLSACIFLVACSPSYKEQNGTFSVLPPELKDCKIYYVRSGDGSGIYITRCPNSSTSTDSGGKHRTTSTVVEAPTQAEPVKPEPPMSVIVDGVEYKR